MKTPSRAAFNIAIATAVIGAIVLIGTTSIKEGNVTNSSFTRSRLLSSTSLTVKGNNGSPKTVFPLGKCQGDCDSDSECATGLVCFQRSGTEAVPGCSAASKYSGLDFCVDPNSSSSSSSSGNGGTSTGGGTTNSGSAIVITGDNKSPLSAFPLGKCQGDCDSDSDCQPGLVCYQRLNTESVPGCSGASKYSGKDFCIDPSGTTSSNTTTSGTGGTSSGNLPTVSMKGENGSPGSAFPLGQCQGDCDSNSDCEKGLFCYQRSAGESVPGCLGGAMDNTDTDYCIDPYELQSIPPQNSDNRGHSGSVFALKIYWQPGYKWQGETFERKWCMRCNNDNPSCSAGNRIYITNCDIDTLTTEWIFNYVSGDVFQVKVSTSNNCLTVPDDDKEPIIVDTCDSSNDHQLFRAQNGQAAWGSHFELNPVWASDGCVGDTHHPKYGETVYVWKCETSRKWTTNAWNFY
ncbi:hypothetical protein MPSEU_000047400 [Mayamaea pseudoterrestris]|nr:hypothetical protein MPSEU_000047400 [Mayamaea pseudoterrestris]